MPDPLPYDLALDTGDAQLKDLAASLRVWLSRHPVPAAVAPEWAMCPDPHRCSATLPDHAYHRRDRQPAARLLHRRWDATSRPPGWVHGQPLSHLGWSSRHSNSRGGSPTAS